MLGDPGVEGIGGQELGSLNQMKPRLRNDQVEVAGFAADRTIAFQRLDSRRRLDFKLNSPAMAAARVFNQRISRFGLDFKPN